jgi:hypothetical protein
MFALSKKTTKEYGATFIERQKLFYSAETIANMYNNTFPISVEKPILYIFSPPAND